MHCLLCHEKIPRLRAWTGKSEFCCDEHAELYKKQTMERLLVDDSDEREPTQALPLPGSEPLAEQAPALGPAVVENSTDAAEEFWQAAEPTAKPAEAAPRSDPPRTKINHQSGEDALAALRELAAESSNAPSEPAQAAKSEKASAGLTDLEAALARLEEEESLFQTPVAKPEVAPVAETKKPEPEELKTAEPVQERQPDLPDLPDLPAEFAAALEAAPSALEDTPELDLDALDPPDLPELVSAEASAPEPPEMAADFGDDLPLALEAPELEIAAQALPEAPEPPALEVESKPEPKPEKAPAPVAAKRPRPAPKLRPSGRLLPLGPAAQFLMDSSENPWSEALAAIEPERASLLGPAKAMELRKASLNGTASGRFDPVMFKPSEGIAAVGFPIIEPSGPGIEFESASEPAAPTSTVAWPLPLHASLASSEMEFHQAPGPDISLAALAAVEEPQISQEFLSRVAFEGHVLEPKSSAILSLPERDVSASAPDEDYDQFDAAGVGGQNTDDSDGGEQIHVADLF